MPLILMLSRQHQRKEKADSHVSPANHSLVVGGASHLVRTGGEVVSNYPINKNLYTNHKHKPVVLMMTSIFLKQ